MREFVTKPKKLKLSLNGTAYEMRCPTMAENDDLEIKIKASPETSIQTYKEFFVSLGLPMEALNGMDLEDFLDFIGFVLNPKFKGPQQAP